MRRTSKREAKESHIDVDVCAPCRTSLFTQSHSFWWQKLSLLAPKSLYLNKKKRKMLGLIGLEHPSLAAHLHPAILSSAHSMLIKAARPGYLSGRSGLCLSSCHECLQSKASKISRGVVSSTAHDIGNSEQNHLQSPGKSFNKAFQNSQLQNSTTAGCHPPRIHLDTHSALVWAHALASISISAQLWKHRVLFSSATYHLESHFNKSWWARKWVVFAEVSLL